VLELLRKYFNIQDSDDAAGRRAKVTGVLDALDPAPQETTPYLFGLLSVVEGTDPLARMERGSSVNARSTRSDTSCCAKA
jgi:hypothetical protein